MQITYTHAHRAQTEKITLGALVSYGRVQAPRYFAVQAHLPYRTANRNYCPKIRFPPSLNIAFVATVSHTKYSVTDYCNARLVPHTYQHINSYCAGLLSCVRLVVGGERGQKVGGGDASAMIVLNANVMFRRLNCRRTHSTAQHRKRLLKHTHTHRCVSSVCVGV